MKKLLLIFFVLVFNCTYATILPKEVDAQGVVHCYVDSFFVCNIDLSEGENGVACEPGYIPDCNPDSTCCTSQPYGSCSDVPCVLGAPDPPPPDPPDPDPPPPDPDPPGNCPSGYTCDYFGGNAQQDCEVSNAGIFQSCSRPGLEDGNCCIPSGGIYGCYRQVGYGCVVDYSGSGSSSGIPYTCVAGFGPCESGDDSCTSCDELGTDECTQYGSSRAFPCVQTSPYQRYSCLISFGGCQPDAGGAYTDYDTCVIGCQGQGNYRCDSPSQGCVLDPDGDLSAQQCENVCRLDIFRGPELCPDGVSINTAIGCIPVESQQVFIGFLLRWGAGIAGGIAFILIVAAGIMITTSAGDPKKVQAGKELLTAAISGLVLLIFGVFVLEFIGVKILNIPGFGQ